MMLAAFSCSTVSSLHNPNSSIFRTTPGPLMFGLWRFDCTSINEATSSCHALKMLLRQGGFHLTKWISSSRTLLKTLDANERSQPDLNIDIDPLPVERTLCVLWNAENDSFRFRSRELPAVSSKRGMLRAVSSIFDPLGFVSPIVLQAKCILRQTWLLAVDWDDTLPETVMEQWKKWSEELHCVESLAVPRALTSFESIKSIEVHLFSGASELGYGCVAYLRKLLSNGNVSISFICSKARVAPLSI
ncbi:hypothetical protein M514_27496 [Trichuris suis]|uniref:Pao retrotransposon peptidase n=1 Tax=Trichuris suis TaxID=68888 RepID=A0A085MSX3_9BILA|nr:hypothetical protein M514_27496 [Trichuris suis]